MNDRFEPNFGYPEQSPKMGNREIYPGVENQPRRRRRSLLPITIAGIVVIAFAGVLWFTYTGHRQPANGELPVVMAETTPVKIKPDQPGGMAVPYQDTTVYDQLSSAHQKQEPGVEHLLQPPEQPLPKPLPAPEAPAELLPPAGLHDETAVAEVDTLNTDPAALAPPPAVVAAPPATIVPPPHQSIAPPPAQASMPPAPPTKPAPVATPPVLAKPAPLPVTGSGYMLQLGAFRDEATANNDWQTVKAAHAGELGALHSTVEKTVVADKTLYRLKAGPLSEAQARQNCTTLKAANVVCIVVPQ